MYNKAETAKQYLDLYENIDDPTTKGNFMKEVFEYGLAVGRSGDPINQAIGESSQRAATRGAKAIFDKLKNRYWRQDTVRRDLNLSTNERAGRIENNSKFSDGFNIVIRFGDLHSMEDRTTTLLLEQVHIISDGMRISADVPEVGASVRERYQFIARSIHPYR